MALQTVTFNYTGSTQTWTVPRHVPGTLRVTCVGGAGGTYAISSVPFRAGDGGSIRGYLDIARGTTLYVVAGGGGALGTNATTSGLGVGGGPTSGGQGGSGGTDILAIAGGGGAASEIRTAPSSGRLIVAGGGGGGGVKSAADGVIYAGSGGLGVAAGATSAQTVTSASGAGGGGGTTSAAGAGGAHATTPTGITDGANGSAGVGGDGGSKPAGGFPSRRGGGGGGGGYYGGGGGGCGDNAAGSHGGGGGGGSSWADTSVVSGIDDVGANNHSTSSVVNGYIIIEWEPLTEIARCETITYTPGSVVPQGGDGAVVYSSGALDSFGTDETPVDWPTTGAKIKAIEVEVTATDQFTANGQVQVGVFKPDGLDPLDGALSDASGTWSGWDGGTGQYRSSTADAYYLDKFGGWVTDYITWGSGGATGTWLTSTSTATPGTGIDIRARCRRANWTSNADASQVTHICTTGTALGRFNGHVSMYSGAVNFIMLNIPGTSVTGVTAPAAAFSYTNGQWHNFRITYDGVTARFYEDATADEGLGSWTLVHSAAMTAQQTMPTTDWRIGATNANNSGFNGDISHLVALDGAGQSIHDLALGGMDAALDSGWSGTNNTISRSPTFNTAVGATVPATKRVRVDLDTPCPLADFRLIVDAQTGALTVDEILIEAECGGGIYRDGRVHLS